MFFNNFYISLQYKNKFIAMKKDITKNGITIIWDTEKINDVFFTTNDDEKVIQNFAKIPQGF